MNKLPTLKARTQMYLSERRRLGFELRSMGHALRSFARYVDELDCREPLTVEVMAKWARQDQGHSDDPRTWARRLMILRPFTRWLQQFEPRTEIPEEAIFGRIGDRLSPHIYQEQEILDLLAAARRLGPAPGLRGATYEALFRTFFPEIADVPHNSKMGEKNVWVPRSSRCTREWAAKVLKGLSTSQCLPLLSRRKSVPRLIGALLGRRDLEVVALFLYRLFLLDQRLRRAGVAFDWNGI